MLSTLLAMGAHTAISLLAESPGVPPEVSGWANLTATAVILCLFTWMITKHIPDRDKRTEERQDRKDESFARALDSRDKHMEELILIQREIATDIRAIHMQQALIAKKVENESPHKQTS